MLQVTSKEEQHMYMKSGGFVVVNVTIVMKCDLMLFIFVSML
jgi:hypothetical protein